MKIHADDLKNVSLQPDEITPTISPSFVRAWYKEKALLTDEEIVDSLSHDKDQCNYILNFENLLEAHSLSLRDVPQNVDWTSYSKQHPSISAGAGTEYHIVFHYLKERSRSKHFNIEFYRGYYGIDHSITDSELITNWNSDTEQNKRFCSFGELLSYNGLDNIFIDEKVVLKELIEGNRWGQREAWDDLVTALKLMPMRVLQLTGSRETNAGIYESLHRNFIQMGLILKASKLESLIVELGLKAHGNITTRFNSDEITTSKHTKIDPDFYFSWYSDLKFGDKLFLEQHWLNFGFNEGRSPTFEHALHRLGLKIEKLPLEFDWREYIQNTADLHSKDSFYKAAAHKIKNTDDDFSFDTDFYTSAYEDARHLKHQPVNAELHWKSKMLVGMRARSPKEFMSTLELPSSLYPSWLDINKVERLNQELPQDALDTLKDLFTSTPAVRLRVAESDQLNSDFYCNIGTHYESIGQRGRAEELYLIANGFLTNGLALEHLGNIYLNSGLHSRAGKFYSLAIATGNCSEWAYINQAGCMAAQLNIDEIDSVYSKAYTHFPESSKYELSIKENIATIWNIVSKKSASLIKENHRSKLISLVSNTTNSIYDINATQIRLGKLDRYRGSINKKNVTIIGDFHLPQCKRYRIDQKIEQLQAAGITPNVASWTDTPYAQQLMSFSDVCIFYRCPALPEIVKLISTASTLGKITIYEIDDLIFDPAYPQHISTYGGYVSQEEYNDLVMGMALYRSAAMLCDYGIASTQPLSTELAKLVRTNKSFVHRNALDKYSLMLSPGRSAEKQYVNIFYGSGTKAHNSDFIHEALPSILRVLKEEPLARLTVVGYLQLPKKVLEEFGDKIVNAPFTSSFLSYSTYLACADINIAVLKRDKINDAKSELKWFEAALCGVPSVVSATQNYIDVIEDGEDGFLARNDQDWYKILKMLVSNRELRTSVGEQARNRVLVEYGVDNMATRASSIIDLVVQDHQECLTTGPLGKISS